MPYIEDFSEFRSRMDCECYLVRGVHVFANGGQSNGNTHADPPTDPHELLELRVQFLKAKLSGEEKKFNNCKSYITSQAECHSYNAGPPPEEEAFAELECLRQSVLSLREELEEKRAELRARRGPNPMERYEAQRTANRVRARDAVRRASEINI